MYFFSLYPAVVKTLEVNREGGDTGWNQDSRTSAESLNLYHQISVPHSLCCNQVQYIKGLKVSLQKRAKDICQAYYNEVNTVIMALNEVRSNIDVKHKVWHDMAGEKVDASEPQLPRRGHQTARNNTPGDTPESYYRRTISIPFLDELIAHLNSRFSNIQQKAIMGMTTVPSVLMDETTPTSSLSDLLQQYSDDLPNPSSLETELHMWKCKWSSFSKPLPDAPADALVFASQTIFPNIHCLFRLVCTLPVTSCECECSIIGD
jgi:SepF-like predicted cell division protein (DUF552 family)